MSRNTILARRAAVAVALALLATTGPALATPAAPQVDVSVVVEREIVRADSSGKPIFDRQPVKVANPGDVLVYSLKATNVGDGPALDARIEDPLPAGTELLVDSLDHGKAVATASLDDGKTWQPFPARVERKSADGKSETVPAPGRSYTHLRWTLAGPLAPGDSKEVSFKVRVR